MPPKWWIVAPLYQLKVSGQAWADRDSKSLCFTVYCEMLFCSIAQLRVSLQLFSHWRRFCFCFCLFRFLNSQTLRWAADVLPALLLLCDNKNSASLKEEEEGKTRLGFPHTTSSVWNSTWTVRRLHWMSVLSPMCDGERWDETKERWSQNWDKLGFIPP